MAVFARREPYPQPPPPPTSQNSNGQAQSLSGEAESFSERPVDVPGESTAPSLPATRQDESESQNVQQPITVNTTNAPNSNGRAYANRSGLGPNRRTSTSFYDFFFIFVMCSFFGLSHVLL